MVQKVLTAFVVVCLSWSAVAQITGERAAIKYLEKDRFDKALVIFKKALLKDSTNVKANVLMARYFFVARNPDFHIDSAYHYVSKAIIFWQLLPSGDQEKLKRQQIDSATLQALSLRVDSAAFQRAKTLNTVAHYGAYLKQYRALRDEAILLRDDAAFALAFAANTHQALREYIAAYPGSRRLQEARDRFEYLYYKAETSDQQLSSFLRFLEANPQTPFRREIDLNIFQLSTLAGTADVFESFSARFPQSPYDTLARVILQYVLEDDLKPDTVPDGKASHFMYPVLKNGMFGFMNSDGQEVIRPHVSELPQQYRCGNIVEDVLIFEDRVMNDKGTILWEGNTPEVEDLGSGFIAVSSSGKSIILHKSGMRFWADPEVEAKSLNGRLFAIRHADHWGISTLTGKTLVQEQWDDIDVIGNVILFKQKNKISLTTIDNLTNVNGKTEKWNDGFDAVKKLPGNFLWVQSGEYEGVLDPSLAIVIRLDKHRVTPMSSGFLLATSSMQSYVNDQGVESETAEAIDVRGNWIGCKKNGKWSLLDPATLRPGAGRYDSLQIFGAFMVGMNHDTLTVFSLQKRITQLVGSAKFEFIPGQESSGFLVIEQQDKQTVFSQNGAKLFSAGYDRIQYGGKNCFIIQKKDRFRKEKKGLINLQGKEILPAEYDAIATGASPGVLSLLKGKKFGQYTLASKKLIKPEYDKNIQLYSNGVYTGLKDGKFGFLDASNKPLTGFSFQSLHYWTDSVALVEQDKSWLLLNVHSGKPVSQPYLEIKAIRDDSFERIYRVRQGNNYGVISSAKGTVIPVRFTDLVNVGSAENPVYFTEKHVEEASLYVVIYYDSKGKLIRREVYEQDDYERIYCSK